MGTVEEVTVDQESTLQGGNDPVALQMNNITKIFSGDIRACDAVTLEVARGEVHALLGENGAGKSTLMNMLYGLVQPSEGAIFINGSPVAIRSPKDAMALGIGMVHQHFKLFDELTVAENIFFGCEPSSCYLAPGKLSGRAKALCEQHGLTIDVDTPVWQLPLGTRQRVELIRVLHRGAKILILDEPTAVLTPDEATELLHHLRRMAAQGHSVVLITHKLNEALAVSDRITVLRQGKVVSTMMASEATAKNLARLMVDRDVQGARRSGAPTHDDDALLVSDLHVRGDRGEQAVNHCSFKVRQGEVFALAGVAGNGQIELVEALVGLRAIEQGSIKLLDSDIANKAPRLIRDRGVALVPEDRAKYGMISDFSIKENLLLGRTARKEFVRWGFLRAQAIEHEAQLQLREYDVRPQRTDVAIRRLSGGNQQKIVLARELSRTLKLLIVNEPTRGVDLGAAEYVRNKILELRDKGVAIILVSSDLDEVLSVSDRIGVMFRGKVVGILETASTSLEEVGRLMSGVNEPTSEGSS